MAALCWLLYNWSLSEYVEMKNHVFSRSHIAHADLLVLNTSLDPMLASEISSLAVCSCAGDDYFWNHQSTSVHIQSVRGTFLLHLLFFVLPLFNVSSEVLKLYRMTSKHTFCCVFFLY